MNDTSVRAQMIAAVEAALDAPFDSLADEVLALEAAHETVHGHLMAAEE